MNQRSTNRSPVSSYLISSACIVFFFCICVLPLMTGVPISLSNLLLSSDILTESVSEGFSVPSIVPKPGVTSAHRMLIEFQPSGHFPVSVTSVFHSPQA